jgi:Tol biopolymer transport system component
LVLLASVALVSADPVRSGPASPTGIIFERNSDLYAVAVDGSRVVRLTRTRQLETDPAVSPDGSTIAFTRKDRRYYLGTGISTMRLDGSRRQVLTRGYDAHPAWAPGGKAIYFIRYRQTRFGDCGSIFRVSLATRRVRRVTNTARSGHSHQNPAVSPDGAAIAYSDWDACEGGTSSPRLRVVDRNGRRTQDLAKLQQNGYWPNPEHSCPTWSPDGTQLAFRHNADVFVANRDGSGEHRVAGGGHLLIYDAPKWSPDGWWIAYLAYSPPGGNRLFLVHPDGTGLHEVVRNVGSLGGWLPSLPQ